MILVKIFYNIVFTLFFLISSPYYLFKMVRRGNWKRGFLQRFGIYSGAFVEALKGRKVVWFHAVSVGEVNICIKLVKALEPYLDGYRIVVSTTTSTGMGELCKKLPDYIQKIYYPIDLLPCVYKAYKTINPSIIIIVEAEIWPNFLWLAKSAGANTFLVNARLSERSYKGYRRLQFLFGDIFGSFSAVGCSDENDKKRLIELGCPVERVYITGNLKFDSALPDVGENPWIKDALEKIGYKNGMPVIVGGSTHSGEEVILGRIAKRLWEKGHNVLLILVPRHYERAKEVGKELKELGLNFVYRTEIAQGKIEQEQGIKCLLVDTTGELRDIYRFATIVFVGKSLTATGGQNPIEPAVYGKAIIFGKNMQNFDAISKMLLIRNAAIQIESEERLEAAILDLLNNEVKRKLLGKNALDVINENRGALNKTVDMILNITGIDKIHK